MSVRVALVLVMAGTLAACASTPPVPAVPAWVGPEPMVLVQRIRDAGALAANELDVQPVRDAMVEDLRQQAEARHRADDHAAAVAALDHALTLSPDDPSLLQERAEAALWVRDADGAARFAQRALDLGSRTGPLCRRHWTTLQVVHELGEHRALALRDAAKTGGAAPEPLAELGVAAALAASEAKLAAEQAAACAVTGPPRY